MQHAHPQPEVSQSLARRVILPLVVVVLLMMGVGGTALWKLAQRDASLRLERQAETMARSINYAAETLHNDRELQRLVNAMGAEPDVNLIVVAAGNPPRVLASTRNDWIGLPVESLPRAGVGDDLTDAIRTGEASFNHDPTKQEIDSTIPLLLTRPDTELSSGAVMIHLDAASAIWQNTSYAGVLVLSMAVMLSMIAGLAWWLLHRRVLAPVGRMADAIHQGGDLADVPEIHPDEIGMLARAVNDANRRARTSAAGLAEARERAESALREIAALRRALDEHSILSVADASGRILDVNTGFCRISGYAREELIGQDHRLLNGGHHPRSFWIGVWKEIANGHAWRGEVCNRRKDGSVYWVDSTIVPYVGSDGRVEKYVSIRFDITAQKQSEADLIALEERQRMFVEHTPAAVAMLDRDMRYLVASRGWYDEYGLAHESVIGKSHYEVFPTIPERWKELHRRAIAGESLSADRDRFERDDGTITWVRWQIHPWRRQDGSIGGIIMFTEVINEQIEHERALMAARRQAEAASRSKSDFLANMSHEIRTPMTAILGFTELLGDDHHELTREQRDVYIDTIRRNGQHLLSLINDILDVSKIEAGRMTVEHVEVRPVELVRDVMALMSVKAEAKGLRLHAESTGDVPAGVASDPMRLRQILVNLVGNAIKFTEHGEVRIVVGTDADHLFFEIRDTGIGIAETQQAGLFQAFTQADSSTTRKHGGTGLGLHISQRLASMLGGRITVQSEPGRGSTFRLSIRAERWPGARDLYAGPINPAPGAAAPAVQAGADVRPLEGLRILLAEDGPDNTRLITFHLRRAGAEVIAVENGRLAMERLTVDQSADGELHNRSDIDLIITDIQMPEMDGYELAGLLRRRGWDRPIIALTAHAMAGDRERCLAAGCDAYCTKPVQATELVEACRGTLAARADRSGPARDRAA